MVANVNQLKSNVAATTYAAITNPSRQVIVGKVWRDIGNVGWSDGFMIANYNSSPVNVTVRFYEGSTGNVNSTLAYPIGALQSINIFGVVPTNFRGSAVIIADQPVVVQVNSYYPGGDYTTRDVIGSYPATHR